MITGYKLKELIKKFLKNKIVFVPTTHFVNYPDTHINFVKNLIIKNMNFGLWIRNGMSMAANRHKIKLPCVIQ